MKSIIFNKKDGNVISIIENVSSNELNQLDITEITDDNTILKDVKKFHINIATKEIVIDEKTKAQPTYEELQQQLLQSQGVV